MKEIAGEEGDQQETLDGAAYSQQAPLVYAFFPAFTLAHLARCAAAIFLRAAADIV